MTVEELLVYGKSYCHSDLAKILLGEILEKNPLELLNYLEEKVEKEKQEEYKRAVELLRQGKPLQYVLGKVNFYGNKFYINENVLIPRFETEELVENTINYIKKYFKEPVDIIDLGCGSGVIGLTLEKKVSTHSLDLVDISKEALDVAKKNGESLNSSATLIQNDFLENISKKYDVIISNPPYIGTKEEIEDIVKENEPHLALYAGEDGLDCYRKILKNIKNNSKERCLIAFEIGYKQGDLLTNLVKEILPEAKTEIKKDLSEKDRMLFIFQNLE